MKIIMWVLGVVVGGFVLLAAISGITSNSSDGWRRSGGTWVPVPATESDQKAYKRNGIANCWKDQARKSLDPATARFAASVCEQMEAAFMQDFHEKP